MASIEQFITTLKLGELRRQRDFLRQKYDRIEQQAAASATDEEKLRGLYDGLHELQYKFHGIHYEVDNMRMLLMEIDAGRASPDLVGFWLRWLEDQLASGELRSEFVYMFGVLLDEWAFTQKAETPPLPGHAEATQAIRRQVEGSAGIAPGDYAPLLKDLISVSGKLTLSEADARLRNDLDREMVSTVIPPDMEAALKNIRDNIYRPPALRGEVRRVIESDRLPHELGDALSIVLNDLDHWAWPSEGVPALVIEARRKWRLFLGEDLPNACLLDIMGMRWNKEFKERINDKRMDLITQLEQFIELDISESAVQDLRNKIDEAWGLSPGYPLDIWKEAGQPIKKAEPHSIMAYRIETQKKLRDITLLDRYSGQQSTSSMETALMLVNAEIQLGRAAFPEQPLYVLKADLKDFYASISHEVLMTILTDMEAPERQIAFLKRFLEIPIQLDGEVITTRRGLPNDRVLSNWLAELLLRLMDQHIQRAAPVQIVRLVDDICMISPSAEHIRKAWDALKEFCGICGLEINEAKSGSVCIGGERPSGLPENPPGWLMLWLDSDANWHVDTDDLNAYLELVKKRLARESTLLGLIDIYNDELTFLTGELAFGALLGESHREEIRQAMMRFHHDLFGPGEGIAERIASEVKKRFTVENADSAPLAIPDAWLYWPITAGGLGLNHGDVVITEYENDIDYRGLHFEKQPTTRDENWQLKSNDWSRFFRSYLQEVRPQGPHIHGSMQPLVDDFIKRGATLTGGKQKTLSPYWRWVLQIYGPQIIDRFGTFRFLITELVPLQLILQRRVGDEAPGDSENEEIPF